MSLPQRPAGVFAVFFALFLAAFATWRHPGWWRVRRGRLAPTAVP